MINLLYTVPTPDVNVTLSGDQTLGQSSTVLCEVTTVRGVNSTVDIRLSSSNDTVVDMNDAIPDMSMDSSRVYRLRYLIPSLSIDLDGEVYTCEVVINSEPLVRNTNSITLNVTGKIQYITKAAI